MKKLTPTLKGFFCILFVFLFTSCATTDRGLLPYIRAFEKDTGLTIDYPVFFYEDASESKAGKVVGLCRYVGTDVAKYPIHVKIEWNSWQKFPESYRKLLIYHELGHCSMSLGHDHELDFRGCPASGMFPSLPDWWCMKRNGVDYYLNTITGKK